MPRLTPEGWEAAVRSRLRAVRIQRGITFASLRPRKTGWAASRLELQDGRLLLDTVFRLCRAYNVRPDHVLDGWPGWTAGKDSAPAPVASNGELEMLRSPARLVADVRLALLARRHALGRGAPSVALAVFGSRSKSSTLFRLESGETQRPDALLVYRLLLFYDCTFAELIGLTPEVSPCPPRPVSPSPPQPRRSR